MPAATSSKHLFSYSGDVFFRLLTTFFPFFYLDRTSTSRNEVSEMAFWNSGALAGQFQPLPLGIDLSSINNPGTLPEYLVEAVQRWKPSLPIRCALFGQGEMKIVGSFPINAGGFADLWIGEMNDGTVVAIKSYRCYSSSSCVPIYLRLYEEALTCARLTGNENTVPFVGVYSTLEHPCALVFGFMDHLSLREYLRKNRDTGRMELLLEAARGLKYIHSLGIVHGNLKITNVLVDGSGHARIGGLGGASIPRTMPMVDADRSFLGAAPELIDPQWWESTDRGATMASDVYAFATLAWEVFAGEVPFPGEIVVTGVHPMLNRSRPKRPDHPELSNGIWKLIKRCWRKESAKRKTMEEVVAVLEAEINVYKSK